MADETLDTIRGLLESSLEETEDAEVQFKLRTALQLLVVQEESLNGLREAAEHD